MKKNLDEHGIEFIVMAHDPASQLVNKLHRLGVDKVILPRYTYLLGTIPENFEIEPFSIGYAEEVRLFDCLELLK